MQIDIFYKNTLLAAWVLLFFFGDYLFVAHAPKKAELHSYARSRKILGVAMVLFGVQVLVQWLGDFRDNARHVAAAINITIFYLEGVLYGMSFISLLDTSYINRRQLVGDFSRFAFTMVLLWCSTLLLYGSVRLVMMIACAVIFLVDMLRIVKRFFRTYRRAVNDMDNYYPENVQIFVRWLYKSVIGIIVFGLSASILAFAPKWISALWMFAGIFMFIYIFISFQNYMLHYEEVDEAITEDEHTEEDDSEEEYSDEDEDDRKTSPTMAFAELIGSGLARWIDDKRYTQTGITLGQMADELHTNRSALSQYVNNTYGCTFSEWITAIRMDEAKRLLTTDAKLTIEQVSAQCGFSSSSYFSKQFVKLEGIAPTKWRKQKREEV